MIEHLSGDQVLRGERSDSRPDAWFAVNVSVPADSLTALENNPNVRYISPNRSDRSFLDLATAAVGASLAWQYGWDGTGVGVAIIDSGIAPKLDDLTGSNGLTRVVYSESFVAGQNALDAYGHGTHVARI